MKKRMIACALIVGLAVVGVSATAVSRPRWIDNDRPCQSVCQNGRGQGNGQGWRQGNGQGWRQGNGQGWRQGNGQGWNNTANCPWR